ncbi:MAG: hypothetical protein IPN19_00855 [Elusimicrobia bacterium]|nr:hypothetical protein [Elusimicrobiota bacterium]
MRKTGFFFLLACTLLVHCKRDNSHDTINSDQKKVARERAEMASRFVKIPSFPYKDLPSPNSLGNIKLQLTCPDYMAAALLNPEKFKKLFASATPIDPNERKYNFYPWYKGSFDSEGKTYEFDLGFSNLGVLKGPTGLSGWFEFNYDFLECEKYDKNRLSGCWETVKSWNSDSSQCYTYTLSFLDDGRVIWRTNRYKGQACSGEKENNANIIERTMWTFKNVTAITLPDGRSGFRFHLNGDWGLGMDIRQYKPIWNHADTEGSFCYVENRLSFSENITDAVTGLCINTKVKNNSINFDNCLVQTKT